MHFFSDQNFKPVRDQFVGLHDLLDCSNVGMQLRTLFGAPFCPHALASPAASVVDKDIVLKETCVEERPRLQELYVCASLVHVLFVMAPDPRTKATSRRFRRT